MVRRWSRARYEPAAQLEHTEDRYEVTRDGTVIATEAHRRAPATRGYTHVQVRDLYAAADDPIILAVGTKP